MRVCGRIAWLSLAWAVASSAFAQDRVGFNRDVRPILSQNCFACHGPDEKAREAGLRLDTREGATAQGESGRFAIVPGSAAGSELLARVTHADPSERMPPARAGRSLTPGEIETIRRWIDEGAEYERHWSLDPPRRLKPPEPSRPAWVRNPIDAFILDGLDGAGLSPQPEADRRSLLRRLSLDLTGLPPTVDEARAFAEDQAPDAYEQRVERLLASSRHAERMAQEWMDAARYADTNGYHIDNERSMWRWRDWVIDAYHTNMPFDRFTIEQIAGDLLPDATLDQRIASGFHRNHMINFEGGAIPEEYLTNYLVDRVNTTATVWLGLTLACAQCHDHKYDPISQEDYYRFYAFFNAVPEKGLDGNTGNSAPMIDAPFPGQREALDEATAGVDALRARLDAPMPETDAAEDRWRRAIVDRESGVWKAAGPVTAGSLAGTTLTIEPDGSISASGVNEPTDVYEIVLAPTDERAGVVRLEALVPDGASGPGRFENGNFVLTGVELHALTDRDEPRTVRLPIAAALAVFSQPTFDVRGILDDDPATGWAVLDPRGMRPREAWLVLAQPIEAGTTLQVRLRFESKFARHGMARVRFSYAGVDRWAEGKPSEWSSWRSIGPFATGVTNSQEAFEFAHDVEGALTREGFDLAGVDAEGRDVWAPRPDLVDGRAHALPVPDYSSIYLARTIESPNDRSLTLLLGSDDGVVVWLNGRVVHSNPAARALAPGQDVVMLRLPEGRSTLVVKVVNYQGGSGLSFDPRSDDALPVPIDLLALLSRDTLDEAARSAIRAFFRERHSPEWKELREALIRAEAHLAEVRRGIPTTMVMASLDTPRPTFILERGEYDRPGRQVTPGVPPVFGSRPDEPTDRLALARWLVDPSHPLTARVQVNRLWQMVFGVGLVSTPEDFGIQGDWPSNLALLDWLTVEFVENGWDVRHILRLIVTSSTYRQGSRVEPAALALDPANRLLSRHPRLRLGAEGIRDNALAISGLLVERVGGPSVKPYHPSGLWEEMAIDPDGNEFSAQVYVQDKGDALYRRGLYVFWKRSVPHPSMTAFDAPSREVCTVRRTRTNTPLQALVLMNDPTYVEAARAFAQRILLEGGNTDADRVSYALEAAIAAPATEAQRGVLLGLLGEQRVLFRSDPDGAAALLRVGESARDESLDEVEHAAWTMVAGVVLNLDSTICKE